MSLFLFLHFLHELLLTFIEEIQWSVCAVTLANCLVAVSHCRDVALSITALSFNLWFTQLYCKDFRLNLEISEQLLYMLSKSVKLEELVLENSGEFAQRMAQALRGNPDSALSAISLAGNQLEDRGTSRSRPDRQPLQSVPAASGSAQGLLPVLFSPSGSCPVSAQRPVGAGWVWDTPHPTSSLPPTCAPPLKAAAALPKLPLPTDERAGFTASRNAGYFLVHCRALLQGLAYNSQISDLHLDLSSCELRSAGAQVIQDLIFDANSISNLDLSDNGFDADMVTLVLAIGRSKSIRHVSLGKNFNIKSKDNLADVLHRIVQLTQEDDCPLQSLSVAESRLKLGTNILLNALGSNTCLSTLDISGNTIGDTGAKMLAKALQINTKLRTVIWDRNNTTAHGFIDVARALERNYTLRSMPLPMSDVTQAYRSNPEKTEEAVHKVELGPMRRTLPKQTFRLQRGIITSGSEQMVNEMCTSLQKHVNVLSAGLGREVEASVLCAEEAIREANLSISVSLQSVPAARCALSSCFPGPAQLPLSPFRLCQIFKGFLHLLPSPGLSELDLQAAAEDNEIGTHQALLSVSCASLKSRPASTKDAETGSSLLPFPEPAPTQSLMDLPTEGEKLEHYTRARPRPNRRNKQPPIVGIGGTVVLVPALSSCLRSAPVLTLFLASSSCSSPAPRGISPGSAPLVPSGTRTFKKKIGNFFAFKKPKSSRGWRCEKEPEGSPSAAKGRKSTRSDISKPASKAGEANAEPSQPPDAAHRIRPKYSREGKSQSLILLSGEDEEALGVKHEKRRHLEKSDGEIPNSFEQRVHVMLHRIGVTKVLSSEGKKKQVRGHAHAHGQLFFVVTQPLPVSAPSETSSKSPRAWCVPGSHELPHSDSRLLDRAVAPWQTCGMVADGDVDTAEWSVGLIQ
uniref:CARMIL C-terminal domain-containing protein n=1 Tax=Chelydra serpentina TaxID=8475 RepID=A0A8C3SZB4_CHESE